MNTSIQINRESAPIGALATATATALLTLLTSVKINIVLCGVALVSLMCWLISGDYSREAVTWITAWVLHFAVMSSLDIKKGGVQ